MKCKVEILPTAWEDLKQIEDCYLIEFDMKTALKVSDSILDSIERLEQFPDSGSLTPDKWLNEKGYRMIICGKHVAIYKKSADIVYIYHIADTRTDYTKLFTKVSVDPFYSKENLEELKRRIADVQSGKSTLKEHELIDLD